MRVFLNYSVANWNLVQKLRHLLEVGVGIAAGDIFCSMTPSNIPAGQPDIPHILTRLSEANVVVGVLSRSYLQSYFCHGEGCAARVRQIAQNARFYPLMVPPAKYSDLNGALNGMQVESINTKKGLNGLRDAVRNAKSPVFSVWEKLRDTFLADTKPIAEREQALDLTKKITLQDVVLEESDPNNKKVAFPLKMRMVFRNETGKEIQVQTATWEDRPHLLHHRHSPVFQIEDASAGGWKKNKWLPEPKKTGLLLPKQSVPTNYAFRTWIGLHKGINNADDLRRLLVTQSVGVVRIPVTMNGHKLELVKRF